LELEAKDMGGMIAAPDQDPFAFELQRKLSHCNTVKPSPPPKKTPLSAIMARSNVPSPPQISRTASHRPSRLTRLGY
jgi:hypothetical protein